MVLDLSRKAILSFASTFLILSASTGFATDRELQITVGTRSDPQYNKIVDLRLDREDSVFAIQDLCSQDRKEKCEIDVSEHIPKKVKVEKVEQINFSKSKCRDILVCGHYRDEYGIQYDYHALIAHNDGANTWSRIFEQETLGHTKTYLIKLSGLPGRALVWASWQGNRVFMEYRVVGFVDGTTKTLLEKSGIYMGSLDISCNRIIERQGHQAVLYEWEQDGFVATELSREPRRPYPGDTKKIEFTIGKDCNIATSVDSIELDVGQHVMLIRGNRGPIERVLYPGNILHMDKDGVWTAATPGNGQIRIETHACGEKGITEKEIKVRVK